MTIETPVWLQNGVYPARLDRSFIERLMHSAERVFDGLLVQQEAAGTFNVTISAGAAAILGDDTVDQGQYFVRSTASETLALPASPPSGSRTDLVCFQVNDPQAGGGAGDDAEFIVVEGSTVAPDTAVPLATIARTSVEGAILTAAITDVRPLGAYPYTVSASPPSGAGVIGDLWVQVN